LAAAGSALVAGSLLGEPEVRGGKDVIVAAGQVVPDDLYASGETVRIEGTVHGDLVAAARAIVISGTVDGDVLAAAQSITITGTVGDDARIAGQVLHLGPRARLGDDLVAAGFSLETEVGSEVAGTTRFFGYQALLAGEVDEGVAGSMGALELAGPIHGDVDVEVGARGEESPPMFWPTPVPIPTVAPGLEVTGTARLGGTLRYESPTEGAIDPAAEVTGGVHYRKPPPSPETETGPLETIARHARRFVALLLVGVLMLWLAPRWTAGLAETVRTRPLPSLGWGIVLLAAALAGALMIVAVVGLLAWLLGAATLGGLAAAVVVGGGLGDIALVVAVVLACVYLAPAVVALAGGRWALARGGPFTGGRRFAALALGVLVLVALALIPYLGKLITIAALLLGLGSLWLWVAGRLRRTPAAVSGETPVAAG
jgi:cytoskeletal protein CcmA (bactofilin family)